MLTSALLAVAIVCWPPARSLPGLTPVLTSVPGLRRSTSGEHQRGGSWWQTESALGTVDLAGEVDPECRIPGRLAPLAVVGSLAGVVGVLIAGWSAGLALAMLGATAVHMGKNARQTRWIDRRRRQTVDALAALARELRSGASVVAACAAVLTVAGPSSRPLIRQLANAARVGVDSLSPRSQDAPNRANEVSDDQLPARLQAAWSISRRHGVPLAALVQAAATGLAQEVEATTRQQAALAGPRLSGYLLSGLPAVGVLLGIGMGANPIPVLLGPGIGAVLLLTGCGLSCLGLLWSAKISRSR